MTSISVLQRHSCYDSIENLCKDMDELDNELKNMAMLREDVAEVGYAHAPKMLYILNLITKWK